MPKNLVGGNLGYITKNVDITPHFTQILTVAPVRNLVYPTMDARQNRIQRSDMAIYNT